MENTAQLVYSKTEQKKREFARNIVKCNGDKVKAFEMTWPNASHQTALKNAYTVAKHPIVKDEVGCILAQGEITNERVGLKLSKMLDIEKEYYEA